MGQHEIDSENLPYHPEKLPKKDYVSVNDYFSLDIEGDLSTCCGIQGQEGWCLRKVSDLGAALAMALSALCEKRFVDPCFEVFKRFLFVAVAPVEQISADTGVTLRFCRTGVCKAFRAILNPS